MDTHDKELFLSKHGSFTLPKPKHHPFDKCGATKSITCKWVTHSGIPFYSREDSHIDDIFDKVGDILFEYVAMVSSRDHG